MPRHPPTSEQTCAIDLFSTGDSLKINAFAGTGKTTIARLLAKIYYELGVLPRAEVVEADRSQLVGAFVGQTHLPWVYASPVPFGATRSAYVSAASVEHNRRSVFLAAVGSYVVRSARPVSKR